LFPWTEIKKKCRQGEKRTQKTYQIIKAKFYLNEE